MNYKTQGRKLIDSNAAILDILKKKKMTKKLINFGSYY